MILGSPELTKFVIEPWMELEPFDPKLIKEIFPDHPYKYLLNDIYKYAPGRYIKEENGAIPECDDNKDNANYYFKLLDNYTRYGVVFEHKYNLLPGNKLGVFESKYGGKNNYYLVDNNYNKKTLLFNKVKTIDLNEYDTGEKPVSEKEKLKRDLIKKMPNKKLQVAMMDPDVYNNDENFIYTLVRGSNELLIEKFNHRMTYHGFDDFLRINFD